MTAAEQEQTSKANELFADLRKLTPGERLELRMAVKAQTKKEKRERRREVVSS